MSKSMLLFCFLIAGAYASDIPAVVSSAGSSYNHGIRESYHRDQVASGHSYNNGLLGYSSVYGHPGYLGYNGLHYGGIGYPGYSVYNGLGYGGFGYPGYLGYNRIGYDGLGYDGFHGFPYEGRYLS